MDEKKCEQCGAVPARTVTVNAGEYEVTAVLCEQCANSLLPQPDYIPQRFEYNG